MGDVSVGPSSSTTVAFNPYKFSIYRTSAQNTGNGAFGIVNFDTKLFDTNGNVDIAVNVGRYTAPVSGFYQFNARVSTSSASILIVSLYKNGSEIRRGVDTRYTAAATGVTVSSMLQLTAADYVEVFVFGDSARALDVSQTYFNYFDGFLVSRA